MRVKKYIVDTMPDALQKIRSDLGSDAVIINTKEVKLGGFMGMFSKKKIEVIAAIDSSEGNTKVKESVKVSNELTPQQAVASIANRISELKPELRTKREPSQTPTNVASTVSRAYAQSAVSVLEDKTEDLLILSHLPIREESIVVQAPMTVSREDQLFEEIKQMKQLVYQLSIQSGGITIPDVFHHFEKRLKEQGISESTVQHIVQSAIEEATALQVELTEEVATACIRNQLRNVLAKEGRKGVLPGTRVIHFVGPTGVGKTTTIAKLAAEQVLKYNRKVGFITSDTYRIAAIDQLRTYATILNVPIEVVFSPQELNKAFHQLADCDIIFMDTAGRNFRNELYVSELNSLLRTQGDSETFLVLSLTTKYRDMKAITDNFTKFNVDKVLFTKSDETDTYGAVVNLMHDFPLKLSYMTHGQNVPDDINEVSEENLIDMLLEEVV